MEKHCVTTFNPLEFLKNFEGENFDDCIDIIRYGDDFEFKYINFQKINLAKSVINPNEIFKFNMFLISSKLSEYFNSINIMLSFDVPNRNESIVKDIDYAIKHDVYISFSKNEKYFDCGFDFLKKTFHMDSYRYSSSLINMDYYKYFDEDIDKIDNFMEECIYRLLIILCSLNEDEYELAKILFIKSNKNSKNLLQELEIYKKIINGKKNKSINFNDFYEQLMPVEPETGIDMEIDEFKKYIEQNIFDDESLNICEKNLLSWEDFELIIMNLDSSISIIVKNYKKVYSQAINTLILALKTIIELIQQINKTKKYIPQFINELLSRDIINLADKDLLENIYNQLTDYFLDK